MSIKILNSLSVNNESVNLAASTVSFSDEETLQTKLDEGKLGGGTSTGNNLKMTGYVKAAEYTSVVTTDNINGAIGKLEAGIDALNKNIKIADVSGIIVHDRDTKVVIKWSDPDDLVIDGTTLVSWAGTKLVRKVGSIPQDVNDGTLIINNKVRNAYATTYYEDTGLTNDTVYYYRFFPYTATGGVTDGASLRTTPKTGFRYGYRIKKNESDPYTRVEYLYDAVGFTPAHMDYANGQFDYGGWADEWFVTNNKPCMIKSDGTLDYYLNPNDYSKKADGTASDVSNQSYNGNAMSQIPLCWVYRYEDSEYVYEIVSNIQFDDNYEAFAHTNANGEIKENFYYSIYGASDISGKARSLSGKALMRNGTAASEINAAKANGDRWYTHTWSQRELIRTLCVLIGKSTDSQTVFGGGNIKQATSDAGLLTTGTLDNKGQFFGYNDGTHQVKVFHIEKFWGDQWDRVAGVITNGNRYYVKMTPEGEGYRITDTNGYTQITDITVPTASQSFISQIKMSKYGFLPTVVSGSASTYYPDAMWSNTSQLDYLFSGASARAVFANGGFFAFDVSSSPSFSYWHCGCGLSLI